MIGIALPAAHAATACPPGARRRTVATCAALLSALLLIGASSSAHAQLLIAPQPGTAVHDPLEVKPLDPAQLLPIPLPERFRRKPHERVDTLQGPVAPAPPLAGIPSCGVRLPGDTRPRIGLALGGGGARGIAHISILRMLEAAHVPVDCIAGTSMGSLVGGLYASGMSVDDLQALVESTNWSELFNDALPREQRSYRAKQDDRAGLATVGVGIGASGLKISPGVLQGEKIVAMFERATLPVSAINDFNLLPIPFRAVATDLNTGDAVVLDHGNLAMSMRASMSLPGIFQPAQIDDRALLDGGLANQVPIDVVRAMGADVVIAINVGTPLEKLDTGASLLAVVNQIAGMMTTRNTVVQMDSLGARDVAIVPDFDGKVSTGDFSKAKEALAIGAAAAVAARPHVAALGVSPAAYARIVANRGTRSTAMPVIEFVQLDNRTTYDDAVLLAAVPIAIRQPFDPVKTEEGVLRAYGLNTLSVINYEVVHQDGRAGVLLHATPKPQGPNYIQLGLQMSSTLEGTFQTNLRAAILVSPLSPNGAEGRVTLDIGTEPGLAFQYYLPLQPDARNLFYASASWENPNIYLYNADGRNYANYAVQVSSVEAQLVHEFDRDSSVLVGASRSTGHGSVQVGDPTLAPFSFDGASMFVRFNVDSLDSLYYPTSGWYSEVGYTASRRWMGGDGDYDRLDLDILGARSFGVHALQAGARYHTTLSGELPIQGLYRLGGRSRLAGFRFNELTGQDYAIVFAGYSYQASKLWGRAAVLGATIEYGNAWETRSDIRFFDGILNASLYAGFNSWIGPMTFGYGWREGTDGLIFIQVGQPF